MTVSLNWLKEYIDIDLPPEEVGELLTAIGLEVEGMEETQSLPGGLAGIVVGEVLEKDKHPNADRLSVTRVQVGNGEPLHIVCGAPNVAAGQKVLVATVGATLYPNEGDPLTIKKGKIRGEVSEGMICAEDELGIGSSHEGILVLPENAPVGQSAGDYLGNVTDYVYEIGLTPNRSDATNHLGVAVDLAATLQVNFGATRGVTRPSVDAFEVHSNDLPVTVEVRDAEACPRYSGLSIKGVTVGDSPEWLQARLRAIGVRPINNIVDITNFVLHELGQPLHAFDLDQIADRKIIVETLPDQSKFTTLDEVERDLLGTDLMICDGQEKGLCIAGVFGGVGSGVTTSTKNIFLESAHFEAKHIRRTSMHHNLRTDAARIYEKGSDPNITIFALKRAALLIQELAGGTIASDISDFYPSPIEPVSVAVRYDRVNTIIGIDVAPERIRHILEAMEMEITASSDTAFTVRVPTNKSDVTREIDIIEEILRIYGLNNVPVPPRMTSAMANAPQPDPMEVRDRIGDVLAAAGFHEMMALSLSESRYYGDAVNSGEMVYVNNTSNVHLDIMRPTMLYGALEAVVRNQNRQESDLKLFEFGRTYQPGSQSNYDETEHLCLLLTGQRASESWHDVLEGPTTFYSLKAYVQLVLDRLGINSYQVEELSNDDYAFGLRYHRGPMELVRFGRIDNRLEQQMDIRSEVFYADFNWGNVMRSIPKQRVQFEELNKFPSVRRDLALVVDKSVKFEHIHALAAKQAKKLLRATNLFDVYENESQLGAGKKSYAVSFVFENPEKTLSDKEIDKVMSKLINSFEKQLGATIRR